MLSLPAVVRDWDAFRACFYTPDEYIQDQRASQWRSGRRGVSYPTIYAYFSRQSEKQQDILLESRDLTAMCSALPRFSRLHTVEVSFPDATSIPFRWLADRVLLDGQACFPGQFEMVLTALVRARAHGVAIRRFEVTGYYPRMVTKGEALQALGSEAFAQVEDVRIVDSPAMLEFLARTALPAVRRCELESCWLSIPNLQRFVEAHADSLRSLHLDDIEHMVEEISADGIRLSFSSTKAIVDMVRRLRRVESLREITVNRQASGRYEIRDIVDVHAGMGQE